MICDGYNMDGELRDGDVSLRFSYRPMLSAERREFLLAFKGWPNDVALRERSRWLQEHVLAMTPFDTVEYVARIPVLWRRLHHVLVGVLAPDGAKDWSPYWEVFDVRNLRAGIRLAILNPMLAARSCTSCLKWWYREDNGKIEQEHGEDALRPVEFPPMCRTRDGCPVGSPENPLRLTRRNQMAWHHFQRCESVGHWPDDPIVARNALVIRRARDDARAEQRTEYGSGSGGSSGPVARSGRDTTRAYVPADANPFFFAAGDVNI